MGAFRPQVQHQGPDDHCVINGHKLGWDSCTCYATAMAIDRSTLGAKQPSGCDVRRLTGDTTDGTTLRQCATAATHYGVKADIYTGSNVIKPNSAAAKLKVGHSVVLQGNAGALVGTAFQSTNGPVNHAVFLNEGVGWDDNTPDQVLVYDPAADGRRNMDKSPSWWPWSLVLKFAAALQPNGDGTPKLGPGKWYCAIYPDTEPHVFLRFGGVETVPFPDRCRAVAGTGKWVNVHSSPDKTPDTVVDHVADGDLWVAYQVSNRPENDEFRGSKKWYGSQDGHEWVHSKRLSHKGGTT